VENIILVSSVYDTFILQEDGQLSERLLSEFLDLNLHHTTGLTHVSSGAEAIALAKAESRFNLIITTIDVADMNAVELVEGLRTAGVEVPVVLLAYDEAELEDFARRHEISGVERAFLWQGDPRILLAITKYIEDRLNISYDIGVAGVQMILLVEDSIRYYSAFLPLIYTEIIRHSQSLIGEGINTAHKIMRMRARPKIVLCSTYEEASEWFSQYSEHVLGVISDIEFPREGRLDPEAGLRLTEMVKQAWADVPVILQSSRAENRAAAAAVGAEFLLKGSPTLLDDLRRFMVDDFSFGDFIFRMPDGRPVGSAKDLRSMLEALRAVAAESVDYHATRNHFSRWLKARTEFELAHRLRLVPASDKATMEEERQYLIAELEAYRQERAEEPVSDFHAATFDPLRSFARIGEGSLGGKARGLAFARHLLRESGLVVECPDVIMEIPPAVVLCTGVFDRFLEENSLRAVVLDSCTEAEMVRCFLEAPLPRDVEEALSAYLDLARYPLIVRSSSLLEDSRNMPVAGVYDSFVLPNNHPDGSVRRALLAAAVKKVLASTFKNEAKKYFEVTPYRLEEEKMAVIIQRVAGSARGDRFYPDFAGVARSYNFYPTEPLAAEDGIVEVALGLGRSVVEGRPSLSFCPKYPRHLRQFSTVPDMLANSQREFLSVEMQSGDDDVTEAYHPLEIAESDGTLGWVGSTYDPQNDAVYEGLSRDGVRLVSFAPFLSNQPFPLTQLLMRLLDAGRSGMNSEVEIEFAVNHAPKERSSWEFSLLQLRPIAMSRETSELRIDDGDRANALCYSEQVLGNGRLTHIRDIVVVDRAGFDRARTREIAAEIGRLNQRLLAEGRPYVLIGPGRWGSADPWLGIPVTWDQICGAKVIVEAGFEDIDVTPSQGSHFFHNLMSRHLGYFTVDAVSATGMLDWDWLSRQTGLPGYSLVRLLRLSSSLTVKINGRTQHGVIVKPEP
jgi:CheY-like chemotaxis protein